MLGAAAAVVACWCRLWFCLSRLGASPKLLPPGWHHDSAEHEYFERLHNNSLRQHIPTLLAACWFDGCCSPPARVCRRFLVPVDLLGGLWPGGDVPVRAFVELAGLTVTVSPRGSTEAGKGSEARSAELSRVSDANRARPGPARDASRPADGLFA